MFGFGKKVELEVPDGNGGTKRVKVSQKQFDQWVAEGRMSRVNTCKVHVCDPVRGEYETTMVIGKDVDQATHEKLKDGNGDLYLATIYRVGKPDRYFASKDKWELIRDAERNA